MFLFFIYDEKGLLFMLIFFFLALVTLRGKFDVDIDIEDMKSEQRMCQAEPKVCIDFLYEN